MISTASGPRVGEDSRCTGASGSGCTESFRSLLAELFALSASTADSGVERPDSSRDLKELCDLEVAACLSFSCLRLVARCARIADMASSFLHSSDLSFAKHISIELLIAASDRCWSRSVLTYSGPAFCSLKLPTMLIDSFSRSERRLVYRACRASVCLAKPRSVSEGSSGAPETMSGVAERNGKSGVGLSTRDALLGFALPKSSGVGGRCEWSSNGFPTRAADWPSNTVVLWRDSGRCGGSRGGSVGNETLPAFCARV